MKLPEQRPKVTLLYVILRLREDAECISKWSSYSVRIQVGAFIAKHIGMLDKFKAQEDRPHTV